MGDTTVSDGQLEDTDMIPLTHAHILIGVSKATVYRWKDEGRLAVHETGEAGRGMKLYVRVGEIREAYRRIHGTRRKTLNRLLRK